MLKLTLLIEPHTPGADDEARKEKEARRAEKREAKSYKAVQEQQREERAQARSTETIARILDMARPFVEKILNRSAPVGVPESGPVIDGCLRNDHMYGIPAAPIAPPWQRVGADPGEGIVRVRIGGGRPLARVRKTGDCWAWEADRVLSRGSLVLSGTCATAERAIRETDIVLTDAGWEFGYETVLRDFYRDVARMRLDGHMYRDNDPDATARPDDRQNVPIAPFSSAPPPASMAPFDDRGVLRADYGYGGAFAQGVTRVETPLTQVARPVAVEGNDAATAVVSLYGAGAPPAPLQEAYMRQKAHEQENAILAHAARLAEGEGAFAQLVQTWLSNFEVAEAPQPDRSGLLMAMFTRWGRSVSLYFRERGGLAGACVDAIVRGALCPVEDAVVLGKKVALNMVQVGSAQGVPMDQFLEKSMFSRDPLDSTPPSGGLLPKESFERKPSDLNG